MRIQVFFFNLYLQAQNEREKWRAKEKEILVNTTKIIKNKKKKRFGYLITLSRKVK